MRINKNKIIKNTSTLNKSLKALAAREAAASVPSEHDEQKSVVEWWDYVSQMLRVPREVLFAIPNGGKRDIVTASFLKAEGVRPGVPDLFLAYPVGDAHGLFIEMKRRKGGVVSKYQNDMLEILKNLGYKTDVCKGAEEATKRIERYIKTGE